MLGHKTSLNKFKKTEIIQSIFSDYKDMKLEIDYRKKNRKNTNIQRLNNLLEKKPNGSMSKSEKLENTLRQMKIKPQVFKIYMVQQKQFQEGSCRDTGIPQETRKISNKQHSLLSK